MNNFDFAKAEDDFAALISRSEEVEMPLEGMCRIVERELISSLEDLVLGYIQKQSRHDHLYQSSRSAIDSGGLLIMLLTTGKNLKY